MFVHTYEYTYMHVYMYIYIYALSTRKHFSIYLKRSEKYDIGV